MDWLIALGSVCLGLVVGWMAGQTFVRLRALSVTALGAVVSVMVGAAVIGLFQHFLGDNSTGYPTEVWLYPVALLVGVFTAVLTSYSQEKTLKKIEAIALATKIKEENDQAMADTAPIVIQNLLASKGWTAISFHVIRVGSAQNWDDAFLSSLIIKFPHTFRSATLKPGRRPGLKLLPAAVQNS